MDLELADDSPAAIRLEVVIQNKLLRSLVYLCKYDWQGKKIVLIKLHIGPDWSIYQHWNPLPSLLVNFCNYRFPRQLNTNSWMNNSTKWTARHSIISRNCHQKYAV